MINSTTASRPRALQDVLGTIPPAAGEYGQWWAGEQGCALLEEIRDRISGRVVNTVFALYGVRYDRDDVTHSAITLLSDPGLAASVRNAADPWAYLFRVLKRELTGQVGAFLRAPYNVKTFFALNSIPIPERPYTDLMTAARHTWQVLFDHTPAGCRGHLFEVVAYLARRGGHRLSRAGTELSHDPDLLALGYSGSQLRAIANAVLGSRPDFGTNSLLAGYLKDQEWDPLATKAGRRAVRLYGLRMSRHDPRVAA